MLYVFRSKAAADLIMLEAVGDQLLRILGRAPAPSGIIETAALPAAIQALEAAVADERNRRGQGGDAEEDQKEKRVGLKPEGRMPVRADAALTDDAGKTVGRVTSGGFGPSVQHPVAMGYVATAHASPGTRVFADVRGTRVPVEIVSLPFTPHRYRKG